MLTGRVPNSGPGPRACSTPSSWLVRLAVEPVGKEVRQQVLSSSCRQCTVSADTCTQSWCTHTALQAAGRCWWQWSLWEAAVVSALARTCVRVRARTRTHTHTVTLTHTHMSHLSIQLHIQRVILLPPLIADGHCEVLLLTLHRHLQRA